MDGFEKNMEEFDVIFKKCMTNFIDAFALYPNNGKLEELKRKYALYFKIFEDSSPITKSLYSAQCSGKKKPKHVLRTKMSAASPATP